MAEPRPSASVILVRDGAAGLETFMLRRHAQSPVAPSAYVFPGGTVRADDLELDVAQEQRRGERSVELQRALSERADTPISPREAVGNYASAVRELFEEAGVLLVRDRHGQVLQVDDTNTTLQERLASTRLALQARELSLGQVLAAWGFRPAFDLLVPFSHWVTPAALAARFDARFFVAEMPAGQFALHCTIETSEGLWRTPRALLDGDYHIVYATAQHLGRLAAFGAVADLLAFARRKPIRRVQPELIEGSSGVSVVLPPSVQNDW